ncbi:T9SS type A sorting domain-containing protein [Flavivirga amylovorans]|uniref:T9SS type A sorting domain-containing protein n=1 Tax=Flavivirga amylovorans TaxID=870486 RepID=A0ABT8X507_9FLAO|nr:T9SS type A sorting domain-containing protein [Flavivirga amylovorans]MDO5988762.1 T9SS type A sorting domain-containing protein [Flavivirga amylovorans]
MLSRRAFLLLLLISNLSFSQLSVRNDAYVFINDEVVFVEDDINLGEADSSIYLRNEAQVVQGSGTSGNSGIGELSVYQEGNVGAYEYNYWCSPVGSKINNSVNNPFGVTFLNDSTGIITSTPANVGHFGYNGISSPLSIEAYWIWKFIASDEYSEWIHVRGDTSINPGEGFSMKGTAGSGDAQRYDFRGKPNNGTISVSVLDDHFTLVGNPYPSAMDALEYIHDLENAAVITGTLHFWEQDPNVDSHNLRSYEGGYATYTINSAGTVETYTPATFSTYNLDGSINGAASSSPSGKRPRQHIPIGQGFMVEGTATGTVKAKNSHRVFIKETHADSEFFKHSNTKDKTSKSKKSENEFFKVPSDYKRFRINIDFNNSYTRQLVETFHNSTSFGFDYGMESNINQSDILASDAHWLIDGKPYLAEALPYDLSLKIPLAIKLNKESQIRIRIADIQNFETDQPIYLHDIENNTFINLKAQDFNINLEANNYTDRFEIVFDKNSLSTPEINLDDLKVFQNNTISELKISNPNSLNVKGFSLFDVAGKEVESKRFQNNSKKAYTYSTKSLSDGVYILQVNLDNNQVFKKKVIVSNKK